MKKFIILFAVAVCLVTSVLTDTMALYTKTSPTLYGTITAKNNGCSHYPYWNSQKELNHEYKIKDIVQYNAKLYQRNNSGTSQNNMTPDKNKSWVIIECDKCSM